MPDGPPTTDISRPKVGKVPYAPQLISSCTVPGTAALTFDDGPNRYTSDLLGLLDRYNAKATFFVTAINNGKGQIDDPSLPWLELIQHMQLKGHQVASHTWSHPELNQLSPEQRRDELTKTEAALRNILGAFPTYMRPPYSRCDGACLNDLAEFGYHVVLYNIDTNDYRNDDPNAIQKSKDVFDHALAPFKSTEKSWLVIAHDVHEQTVHNLTEHMLKKLSKDGYRPVTVGECLGDPSELWYRHDTRSSNFGKPSANETSCGKRHAHACIGDDFSGSRNGYCRDSSDNCETGSQDSATGNTTIPHGNGTISGNATQGVQSGGGRVTSLAVAVLVPSSLAIILTVSALTMALPA